jgi:drug/metabolite transporter (DMT)-like permease
MDKSRAPEFALLALLALLWGSSYLFIKVAVAEIPPLTLIAARASIAALILMGVMRWRGNKFPRDRAIIGGLFIQSLLNATFAWVLLAWGQQYLDSGLASVLNSTSPIFVFFLTLIFTRHEAATPIRLIGACIGVGGVTLIVGVEALNGLGQQVAGQLAALGGAFIYGCAAIYGRRFSHLRPTVTAASTMIWAVAVLVPAALIVDEPWTLTPSTTALGATLALGVFSTGIALVIYFRLIRTLGSMGAASQAYLRAGVGVVLGVVLLGEHIPPTVALGLAASILGVMLINWRRVQDGQRREARN